MILHEFFRSGASFRVRIALNLKGVEAERRFVHLRKGEQRTPEFLALNPQGMVPALEVDGAVMTQSLAIIEYLDEQFPDPPLLPSDPIGRARVRGFAQMIACDIHPLGNLRVLSFLRDAFAHSGDEADQWFNHWIGLGLKVIEERLAETASGRFCHGETPTIADICLFPVMASAGRFGLDLTPFERCRRVYDEAMKLPAFSGAMPAAQPDAE